VTIQKNMTKPAPTLAAAHHGVAKGEPMYAICAQSNVIKDMPMPLHGAQHLKRCNEAQSTYWLYPNIWLTGMLSGAIQQTQLK
jgi:hypothetical protein